MIAIPTAQELRDYKDSNCSESEELAARLLYCAGEFSNDDMEVCEELSEDLRAELVSMGYDVSEPQTRDRNGAPYVDWYTKSPYTVTTISWRKK